MRHCREWKTVQSKPYGSGAEEKIAQALIVRQTVTQLTVVGIVCMIRNRMLCQCQHFDDVANIGVDEFEH